MNIKTNEEGLYRIYEKEAHKIKCMDFNVP
jgi:hypothetical protein